MNWKILLLLVVIAGAGVFAVYKLQIPSAPSAQDQASALLLPELAQNINTIEKLSLSKSENQAVAELQRSDEAWLTLNKNNYPADLNKIRKLVLDLSKAKIIERKTSNPELYQHLGVEDITTADATGMQLVISGLAKPISLIIGDNASAGAGTYVRLSDGAQSVLIDTTISLNDDISAWLQQPITDIPGERIQRANVRHPDGEVVTVHKEKRSDENFKLFNILADRELTYDTVANPTGHVLTSLQLDDVVPRESLDLSEQTLIETDYYTFDGLKITVSAYQQDENTRYIMFDVVYDEAQAEQFASSDNQSDNTAKGENGQPEQVRSEAEQLNQRLQPWAFAVSEFKFRNLSKRLEDFLKPLPESSEDLNSSANENTETSTQ